MLPLSAGPEHTAAYRVTTEDYRTGRSHPGEDGILYQGYLRRYWYWSCCSWYRLRAVSSCCLFSRSWSPSPCHQPKDKELPLKTPSAAYEAPMSLGRSEYLRSNIKEAIAWQHKKTFDICSSNKCEKTQYHCCPQGGSKGLRLL